MSEIFKNNRRKLIEIINKDKFAIVLFSGKQAIKLGDQKYPFTPSRNFFYLTGISEQNLIFLSFKNGDIQEEILFIERADEVKAKWDGEFLESYKATEISGIKMIKYIDEFEEIFSTIIFKNHLETLFLDLENRYFKNSSLANDFAIKVKDMYPYMDIKNIYKNCAILRGQKQPYEIENIKKAIEITKNGIYSIMKNCSAGKMEYEIEAHFDFELKKNGVKEKAFETIFASGKNATILHYKDNNDKIGENELVLIDLGATFGHYSADISRTFPANKKFTDRQKLFYNIVLEAQKLAIDNVKIGVKISDIQNMVKDFYFEKLKEIGLVQKKEDVDKYYFHNLGHYLGLETHDISSEDYDILKENVVLTIEPGLYIREENIGIRIEDDILVTKSGAEVLSKDIIKTIEDIENFMQDN